MTLYEAARLCSAAYSKELADDWANDLKKKLPKFGYSFVNYYVDNASHWFIADSASTRVVVARGTDSAAGWFSNIAAFRFVSSFPALMKLQWPMVDGPFKQRVHRGFYETVDRLWNDVRPYLDGKKPIILTGHSRGGAEMRVLAAKMCEHGYIPESMFTFGEPASLHPLLAITVDVKVPGPNIRAVNKSDLVPRLLPVARYLGWIGHAGTMTYFSRRGEYLTNPSDWFVTLDRWIARLACESSPFADHEMARYHQLARQRQHRLDKLGRSDVHTKPMTRPNP